MKFDSYKVNPHHRARVPKKGRWTVDEWEELRLFALASEKKWTAFASTNHRVLWAISSTDTGHAKLGESDVNGRTIDLYIAKFVVDSNGQWHGYPVAPRTSDVPPVSVVTAWKHAGLVTKVDKNRILTGKL